MGSSRQWIGKWKGGRIFQGKDGPVYVLRKMINGHAYTIHLDARSETEAEAELALFLRDPQGYSTRREAQHRKRAAAVYVDVETVGRFLEHLRREQVTERYWRAVRSNMADWAQALAGRDLRTVTLQELLRELAKYQRGRTNRIVALKSFTSFLREVEGTLTVAEDPTLALKVPSARPEKALREKGYSIETVEKVYRAITATTSNKVTWRGTGRRTDAQAIRDVLCIRAKTGMHGSEIERLARGEGKVTVLENQGEIAATVKFVHKSGRIHLQSIDHQTLAAVQRLQARSAAPVESYIRKALRRYCKPLGLSKFAFGELRHSFITWASEVGVEVRAKSGGLPLASIAAVVGHTSALTTKKFYENVKVPPLIKVPLTLQHPDDPPYLPAQVAASA